MDRPGRCIRESERGLEVGEAPARRGYMWNGSQADSESQGADPIGYACVKRSKQSKVTCRGSAQKNGEQAGWGHQSNPTRPRRTTLHPVTLGSYHRRSSATRFLVTVHFGYTKKEGGNRHNECYERVTTWACEAGWCMHSLG
eukprot:361824-Chlamydomonas_euryale.AAC.2